MVLEQKYAAREKRDAKKAVRVQAELELQQQAKRSLRDFRATNKRAALLVIATLGVRNRDDKRRLRGVDCVNRTSCNVAYTEDPTAASSKNSFRQPRTRRYRAGRAGVFQFDGRAIQDPVPRSQVSACDQVPYGSVFTPGGKESYKPIMKMTWTRAAHEQIDWDNIARERPDGSSSWVATLLNRSVGHPGLLTSFGSVPYHLTQTKKLF